jgi:hypothetical protein
MEKPNSPPQASVLDVVFWQVSGALIGAAAGVAVAMWATGPSAFLACTVLAGLLLGGLVGTLWGWKP